jgi:prevent-host-death family protein
MNWNIADAKQKFSELIRAAEDEPQWIYNRDKLVAAVIPAATLQEFLAWRNEQERPSLGEAFAELRRICEEEEYTFENPLRQERPDPFPDALDEEWERKTQRQGTLADFFAASPLRDSGLEVERP